MSDAGAAGSARKNAPPRLRALLCLTLRSLIGVLRLVWPVFRDTIGRAVAQVHGAARVTLRHTGIRNTETVTMETMPPEPRAFRLSARHPPPELKMPGIGGELGIGRQLPPCLAVEAGRNLVEAG